VAADQELAARFPCLGGDCAVYVTGDGPDGTAAEALSMAQRTLLRWHRDFSRFEPDSELSRLNADARGEVEVSPLMARFVTEALHAAAASGGLVDATLLGEIEAAGYRGDLQQPVPLPAALAKAPPRRAGQPRADPAWRQIEVDVARRLVRRPAGVKLDSGGIAKGLFADELGRILAGHPSYAVDCAGDVRLGGSAGLVRSVKVASPFSGETIIHEFAAVDLGIATSGIGRRSWTDEDGSPAHHLLDPATGRPAYTGIAQVTALAARAVEAEWRAKAALLSGPHGAERWLTGGGVIVLDDGSQRVVEPPAG
jgi:thiamine biosynthesis lipoprotein